MKIELIISRTLIAALLCLFAAGCVKENGQAGEPSDGDLIYLSANLDNSPSIAVDGTKAPVVEWKNTKVMFAYGRGANNYAEHWTAQITTHGDVIFSPVRAYAADNSYVHLKGFYPRGETVGADFNKVYYTITGQEDIMVSNNINVGRLDNKTRSEYAVFKHLLSRFSFTIHNDPAEPFPPISKILGLSVSARYPDSSPLRSEVMLNLANNTLAFSGLSGTMTAYDSSMGDGVPIEYGDNRNFLSVMFEPDRYMDLYIEYLGVDDVVKTSNTHLSVKPQAGKSYEIVLQFTGVGFSISSVNITPWTAGVVPGNQGGSGTDPIQIW